MHTALYRCDDRGLYVPSPSSGGPWSPQHQHGGPPCGLLAYLAERESGASEDRTRRQPATPLASHREPATLPHWRAARCSVDLFRPVPLSPLRGEAVVLRAGRRLQLVRSRLLEEGGEPVCQAHVLFLRPAPGGADTGAENPIDALAGTAETATENLPETAATAPSPPGDDEEPQSMISPRHRSKLPSGFHFLVEVCWRTWRDAPGAWVRMPMPLLEGVKTSPFARAATLSDFANALTGRYRAARGASDFGFINCDSSLHLVRAPRGDWLFLGCERFGAEAGIGHCSVGLYDESGRCGTIHQTSLRQARG